MAKTIADFLARAPVVPVLTIEHLAHAVPLAKALVAGGLTALEITLRTDAALAAIRAIRDAVPAAVPGVGTVVRASDFAAAAAAGAEFAVSPGFTAELAAAAQVQGAMPFLPGVSTASELMVATAAGFEVLKFFPAEPAGGVAALRALAGPFPDVRFCPTGGISADNAGDYLALPNVVAVGGSWVAPKDAVASGDWGRITALARAACALV